MGNSEFNAVVGSHEICLGDRRYPISVYQRGSDYYAAWYCSICLTRTETDLQYSFRSAKDQASEAVGAHHAANHVS